MKLLIVDTQNLIMNEKLYNFDVLKENLRTLIQTARKNNIEVIYVRHDDGAENALTRGKAGFEIFNEFQPEKNEHIFDKTVNSSFSNTGLLEYLKNQNEHTVIVVGLQTEYCIDATIKSGFEHGFEIIVPSDCNSTFDNEYMSAENTYKYYNDFIWKNRYAECIPLEDVLTVMKRGNR